jgi:hypothetical protein
MMRVLAFIPHILAVFIAVIFADSLRYKFLNHEKTQVIFGKLNEWAGSIGCPGAFGPSGLFSQYVIGSVELVACVLLIVGIMPALRFLQGIGALIAFCLMTGAVSFHLFTPLGIDPNNDGGGLFLAAVLVWLSSIVLVIVRRKELLSLFQKLS